MRWCASHRILVISLAILVLALGGVAAWALTAGSPGTGRPAGPPPGHRTSNSASSAPPTSPPASPPASSSSSAPTNSSAPTASSAPTTSPGNPPHVMIVVMENHGFGTIIGNPTAPYLNSLARRYGLATASYATTHPSLPNYLTLVSGTTQGITDDCTTCAANGRQLADQLESVGIGWHAFMESAPDACYTGTAPPFDKHHDPFVYAPHIVGNPAECDNVLPYSTLSPELSGGTAPPFLWVTPNIEHDMHTGSVREGDKWLSQQLPLVLRSSWYRDGGIVIVTWDEGTTDAGCCSGAAGGHIATIVVSALTRSGARLSTSVDDAGVLRTIEALYGLPYLGAAADPNSGTLLPLVGRQPAG